MMTGQKTRLMSEINVTPFVDVMLVLLVIFMVTAPMMTSGMKVDVPQTTHERMDIEPKGLVVSVDASRRVTINDYQLDASEIAEHKRMMRKDGGHVYPKMKYGAGSGEGRLEKIDEYGLKGPSKTR